MHPAGLLARDPVRSAAFVLVGVSLLVRGWLVVHRGLYADDLLFGYRAATLPLHSTDFLLGRQDGHVMPAGFLLAGVLSRLAPLEWWPEAVALLVLQALASLAVLRLLRALLGTRPVLLVPLAVALFSPLSLGALGWWAAAINALPLQIGLAWVAADALALVRTGRSRYAVTGTAAVALSLACYERAVLVPWVALALAVLVVRTEGVASPVRAVLRRGRALWAGSLAVTAAWVGVYLSTTASSSIGASVASVTRMAGRTAQTMLPGVVGGPWRWTDVPPGTPLADPPRALAAAGAVVLVAGVVWVCRVRRGAWVVLALTVAYLLAGTLLVALGRSATTLADLLPQTYRYSSADPVVLAAAVALLFRLPAQPRPAPRGAPAPRRAPVRPGVVLAGVTVAFVVGSLVSTADYVRSWAGDPTADYLATARTSLAAAGSAPLLDQPVPEAVMWSPAYPANLASHVFAPLTDRPDFRPWTSDLRVLDAAGRLVPAQVGPARQTLPGPQPGCGWPVAAGAGRTTLPFDADIFAWPWTVQLDYTADRDGVLTVALDDGEPVQAQVTHGSHSVFVQLTGAASGIHLSTGTAGPDLCVSRGVLGQVTTG